MALDARWVDRLFERLTLAYGVAFLRQWDGIDVAEVKRFWADDLDGLSAERIAYGLANLSPDKPPTAQQFRHACRRAPEKPQAALPAPRPTEADKERVRQMLKGVRDRITGSAA